MRTVDEVERELEQARREALFWRLEADFLSRFFRKCIVVPRARVSGCGRDELIGGDDGV